MSAADNRVEKLFRSLTAKERAIMRLRWFKEDAEEPAELLQTTPWEQINEINRLARLADATNHEVTWYALWAQARLDAINVRFGMVDCLWLWSLHADQLRLLVPDRSGREGKRLRAERDAIRDLLGQAPCLLPLDAEEYEEGSGVSVLGRNLLRLVAGELKATWSELLALEQLVSEATGQFEGEEVMHPGARQLLHDVRSVAIGLQESLRPWFGDLVLPEEPDQDVVGALAVIIKQRRGET